MFLHYCISTRRLILPPNWKDLPPTSRLVVCLLLEKSNMSNLLTLFELYPLGNDTKYTDTRTCYEFAVKHTGNGTGNDGNVIKQWC